MFQLRQVNLFKDLSGYELAKVAAVADEFRMAAGDEIFGENESCPGLHLIVRGGISIETCQAGDSNSSKELARLGPGQLFAMTTLIGGNWSAVKARATEETVVLRIATEEFRAITMEHPEIALRTCQVLSERLGGILEQ